MSLKILEEALDGMMKRLIGDKMNYAQEQLRKIDALVAEYVMELDLTITHCCGLEIGISADGHAFCQAMTDRGGRHDPPTKRSAPYYSSCITEAWEVVEKLKQEYDRVFVTAHMIDGEYTCEIEYQYGSDPAKYWEAEADTAPLAICLAALQAKGVDVEKEL